MGTDADSLAFFDAETCETLAFAFLRWLFLSKFSKEWRGRRDSNRRPPKTLPHTFLNQFAAIVMFRSTRVVQVSIFGGAA